MIDDVTKDEWEFHSWVLNDPPSSLNLVDVSLLWKDWKETCIYKVFLNGTTTESGSVQRVTIRNDEKSMTLKDFFYVCEQKFRLGRHGYLKYLYDLNGNLIDDLSKE